MEVRRNRAEPGIWTEDQETDYNKRTPPGGDSDVGKRRSQFLRLRRLCSDNDGFHVRFREMVTFFSQRGYPRSLLHNDLRRVATISRPDALRSSEQNDTTSDGVPLVLTYHSFNTQSKRYLLQNFRILSTDQQTHNIFPQPPFVACERDINLHFNCTGHSISDDQVRGVVLCGGTNLHRK